MSHSGISLSTIAPLLIASLFLLPTLGIAKQSGTLKTVPLGKWAIISPPFSEDAHGKAIVLASAPRNKWDVDAGPDGEGMMRDQCNELLHGVDHGMVGESLRKELACLNVYEDREKCRAYTVVRVDMQKSRCEVSDGGLLFQTVLHPSMQDEVTR